ncbi:tyrosine-type recombinase/integrase [Planktosalinus lacus]|uniref:Tyrosine recombinase XerC n=1 Tax=Planktosalinus lacus TaxID=1526573 RepID=A0A8J2Y9W3_9FLAO|nr:tyrosine-type recombinase/integrase [Planktosalinus lacus]GGD88550.1 integrase [Planktosalinus lacus]
MSVSAFIDYLSLEKKYSPHTVLAYHKDLESFLQFIEKQLECGNSKEVNYAMIRSWIVTLVDQGLNTRSINRKIASLKAYYKFLIKTKQISENPLAKHTSLKTAKTIQVPFSKNEISKVLDALDQDKNFESIRNKTIVELFYATGMRKSELIELKISDLDLTKQTVKIIGKRNKERIVPLLNSTVMSLRDYIDIRSKAEKANQSPFLFISKNGVKVNQSLVYRIINNYFSTVSTKEKKSPHILRHSFATHLLNEGADLNSIKELLGHASLASTQVYTNNSIAELKKVYANSHPRTNNK